MIVDRNYIFTLYSMGAGAVFRYLQQLEQRVEDAEVRVTRSQQTLVERLSKELSSTKRTLARKSHQLVHERQLNHQLMRRIRELEHEIERSIPTIERDSHNSSTPPSLDPPWKKVKHTKSLRRKSGLRVGGQFGHPGATLRQTSQPDHIVIHAVELCKNCGSSFDQGQPPAIIRRRSEERRVGKECRSRWSPYH